MPFKIYRIFRGFFAFSAFCYGLHCIEITSSSSTIHWGHVAAWTIGPPLWFFFEYWGIDNGWIRLTSGQNKTKTLKEVKEYADLASKIWAGILAVILFWKS